jgi:hypothetical protein
MPSGGWLGPTKGPPDSVDIRGDSGGFLQAILDAVQTLQTGINGPEGPTVVSFHTIPLELDADTLNQEIVAAPGADRQIWIYSVFAMADVDEGTFHLHQNDGTAVSGTQPIADTGGFVLDPSGNWSMPWATLETNQALEGDTVTCSIDGMLTYAIVSI